MSSYDYSQITNAQMLDWAKALKRTTPKPLDASSMFNSLADAESYAKGDGSDIRGLGRTSYVGQIITVYENSKVSTYQIGLKVEKNDEGEDVEVRILQSIGGGVTIVENFTVVDGAIAEATADNVGKLYYVTTGNTTYPKGLWIITGVNKVAAFATPDNISIVKKATPSSGASATYELQINGIKQGVSIDIPKDLVVSSGSIVTFTDSDKPFPVGVTVAGTYIKLTLANSGGDLYINVNSLVDVYTAGDNYINVNNYKISLNWSNVVSALIVDTNFVKYINTQLSNLETVITEFIEAGYVSKELGGKIPLYNFEIEFYNDIIEYKGYFEEEYLNFKVKTPGGLETYEVHGVTIYNDEGREVVAQPTENTNEFKISLPDLGLFLPPEGFRSDRLNLTFKVTLVNPNDTLTQVHVNKFVNIYNFREVYVGQCSEQGFNDRNFSGPALYRFGYVPELKLNHFKSDVQILGNMDMTYIEENGAEPTPSGGVPIPQYLMFVLRLRSMSDTTFNSIRVKSNGFTIPFESTGALVMNPSEAFPNNPELGTFAYRAFRSSVPMLLEEIIENLEVEFCKQ